MTLKFMDGFESYNDAADFRQVWIGSEDDSQYTFPTNGRRSGTKCLAWQPGLNSTNLNPPVNSNTFISSEYAIVGFAFRVTNHSNDYDHEIILNNSSSGGMRLLFMAGTPDIYIYRAGISWGFIDTISYDHDTWNYLEFKCKLGDGTDGHIVVRLNEQELINWTGDNRYQGTYQINKFYFSLQRYWYLLIDDLYVAGSEGSYNNDFLGDIRVDVINPNGAGNYTDLTPSAGANYECVDEAIIDESDYVEGANVGEKDSYSYADVPTDIDDAGIFAVDLRTISQRTAASDNIKIDGLIRKSSTDYNASADLSLSDSWSNKNFIFERDPSDSNIWTKAKINACEFGVEVA